MAIAKLMQHLFARRHGSRSRADKPAAARFDGEWYVVAYPEAGDAIAHGEVAGAEAYYRQVGIEQLHDPNPLFSEGWYRQHYRDVATAITDGVYACGFDHYAAGGYREGRRANALDIDEDGYSERYPDVARLIARGRFASALEHYLTIGAGEGRDPHAAFAELWYRQRYPDVGAAIERRRYLCGYQHFLTAGLDEGRQPHPQYREELYRLWNADVDAAVNDGSLRHAWLHLVGQGLAEGRRWRAESASPSVRQAATTLASCRLDEVLFGDATLRFAPPQQPEVSVVVVLFNRAELTLACLTSLAGVADPTLEVILVDNASSDRTRQLLDRVEGVRVLAQTENLGFTRAANLGAEAARGRYLLFLNSDAEVLPTSLRSAVDRLAATAEAGAVGGRVIGLDGKLQEAGAIVWRDATTDGYGAGDDPRSGAYFFAREVDYCSGVFLLTPRRLFAELGGFDLRFTPAYYEEADYCFRLRRHGHKVIYDPGSVVLHFGSASVPKETYLFKLLAKNRPVFRDLHQQALERALPPDRDHLFAASNRAPTRGRLLWLDDHVPRDSLGAGFPRLRQLLHAAADLGWTVTFFATHPNELDGEEARRDLSTRGIEFLGHLGRERFAEFWQGRQRDYDVVVVSRQHNLHKLLASDVDFKAARPNLRLIYDSEALVASRLELRSQVLGESADGELGGGGLALDDELALAARADEVWCVSQKEAEILRRRAARVTVLSHAVEPRLGETAFDDRHGLLFIGRLAETWNPNVDGLRWFLDDVWPLLYRHGQELTLTVVGVIGDLELPRPPGVRYLGRVDDLEPLYLKHRLFLAPSRFAAGIPLKILGAAAHGLPVVASQLVADQLGWQNDRELLAAPADPATFADAVARLYGDSDLWRRLRQQAAQRLAVDYTYDRLRQTLAGALDG